MTIAPGFMDLLSNFRNNLAGGSVELKVNTNDLINAASDIENGGYFIRDIAPRL